ncbi:hypothetical protein [Nocardia abscessus]|uniref:hypothetical protein n=1 Tax=Nocardia abscessus TaxID=120957 RepID=UPI0003097F2C|nr:hypothetical protein [Nocardia abscessus]MCC3333548.1 helix-turn-helix domain-containing protein [Nocardia abscessus]
MTENDEFDVAIDGYFAIVPEWVIDAEISDRAVRLYARLRRHAGPSLTAARPSRAKLAVKLRTSVKSIDRALRELEDVGAVTIRHRWSDPQGKEYVFARDLDHPIPAPSGYVIHNVPSVPNREGGGVTGDATPRDTGDQTVGTPVTPPVGTPVGVGVGTPVTHERESFETEVKDLGAPSASHTSESHSKQRKRRATRLPDDWAPTDTHRRYCGERGINLEHEAHNFRLHAEENDRRAVVWNAAFARWLMNARPTRTATGTSETGRLWQD